MANKSLSFLTKLALVILLLFLSATTAEAYEVTITNDSAYTCQISVWTMHLFFSQNEGTATLQPGQSHTWQTGAWCPSGFSGDILGPQGWRNLQMTNCLGNNCSSSTGFMATCCWNLNYKICKKISGNHIELRDNDYGFCKQ